MQEGKTEHHFPKKENIREYFLLYNFSQAQYFS